MTTMKTEPMAQLELVFRPWTGAPDAKELARIANASNLAEGVEQHNTPEEMLNYFGHPGDHMDAARDVILVEHGGDAVGYGWHSWVDTSDGLQEHRLGGYVHPDWTRRGIGRRLLAWLEGRARESAAEHPTENPIVYGSWADEKRVGKQALLEQEGYTAIRWFFDMRRDGLDTVDVPPMPVGLEVRPIPTDRVSLRRLFDADGEAFEDHWGGFPFNDATFEEWLAEPNHDPRLHVVAWDGDEIAGGVVNAIAQAENAAFGIKRGWLESVFVRRPWRRRGLAAALVARSMVVLRKAGMDHAMLGVDADNPTGALGVYERAGFTVVKRSSAYRKPMESSS
jgi:GNAT superfamily N-acetyltransferase